MKVVIAGCGEVGRAIASHMVQEGFNVVVIDESAEALAKLSETLDVQTVRGRGSRPSIQEEAGMADAELLIAVTADDEINLMTCQVAHALYQTPKKIARVRAPSYLKLIEQHLMNPQSMAVDMIISPEREVAAAIERTLQVPGAFDAYDFAGGAVQLVGVKVSERSRILGEKMSRWGFLKVPFHAVSLVRKDRMIVPEGSDRLEVGDELYMAVRPADLPAALDMLGKVEPPVRDALIVGGGNVGFNLCKSLEAQGINLRVLERDMERAEFLAKELTHTTVLQGDALDSRLLGQENMQNMDVVLCVTSDDSANIIASVMARQAGVPSVLTLVHKNDFITLAEGVGLERIISPRQITVSRILQHIRRGAVADVHTLRDGLAEVLEFEVRGGTAVVGQTLAHVGLPQGAKVVALVRSNNTVVLPHENEHAVIHPTNRVVVFAEYHSIGAVERLFGAR
ncbi:MAG: Trk system potassium transporter TrkA [Alphaproteobacteria bacterium]